MFKNPQLYFISLKMKVNVHTSPRRRSSKMWPQHFSFGFIFALNHWAIFFKYTSCVVVASALAVPLAQKTYYPAIPSPPSLLYSNITFSVRPQPAHPSKNCSFTPIPYTLSNSLAFKVILHTFCFPN